MSAQDIRSPPVNLGTGKPTDQSASDQSPRLDSWKEIAAYLKRDIRTVQIWEKKEGLPVHRHAHTARASVYAYTAEIDAWQQQRRPQIDFRNEPLDDTQVNPLPARSLRRKMAIYITAGCVVSFTFAIAAIQYWRHGYERGNIFGKHLTIAVLPFEDLSAGHLEDYLADGLTDDLITNLGRSGQLQVISRTSISRFKGKHEPLPQIAKALHASLILEGTITYSGKHGRVTAQLIDANSDRHVWTNSYQRDFDNELAMRDEIADEVASSIIEKLTGDPSTGVKDAKPVDPSVRVAYLRGRFFWNKRDEAGLKEAIRYFDQAISADPQYPPAYAGLADCYNLLSVWGSLSPHEAFPKAKQTALKAIQLDPSSAEAYTSLAFEAYRYDWDFAGAERNFRKAIELNPNYATAHQWYGEFLGDLRRFDQSISESRKAEQLDPLSTIVGSDLADSYIHAGRYREAIDELAKMLTMDPGFIPAHLYLSGVYSLAGEKAKAAEEKEKYIELSGDTGAFRVARIAEEWSSGKKKQAQREIDDLLRHPGEGRFGFFQMAQMYLSIGDRDKAFACLEKAYGEHSWWLVTLLVDPGLASVRSDPRLQNLARRVGLPQE